MNFLKDISFAQVYIGQGNKDALSDFLIPALEVSSLYDRVAGYFSSSVFIQTARGISKLVKHGGRIRLVTSINLSMHDIEALRESNGSGSTDVWTALSNEVLSTASNYGSIEEKFKADHVRAMCWLLANNQLEIKIVVRKEGNLNAFQVSEYEKFHPKFGILKDTLGDSVVFSGSANETWLGWGQNIENLSTYKSWDKFLAGYVEAYTKKFSDYWNNYNLGDWECVNLPTALEKDLLKIHEQFPELPDLSKYERTNKQRVAVADARVPRKYQQAALEAWEKAGRVGILEMATGTGKTFTASLCIASANAMGSLLTVVVVPYQHIADQWSRELSDRNPYQVGSSGDWRKDLSGTLLEAKLGLVENLTIVVVKNTAASDAFLQLVGNLCNEFSHFLFIGDEVHWLGAPSMQKALNTKAKFRLGLSATPDRYYDDLGSEKLRDYFGSESIYEFGLEEALNWPNEDGSIGILTPYEYHPIFVELNSDENQAYRNFSKQIAHLKSVKDKTRENQEEIERLQNLRSDIAKQATSKISALHSLLLKLADGLSHTLIYCANTAQMDRAIEVARKLQIDTPARITSNESASKTDYFRGKSEREHILSNFAQGNHEIIFAIACLDEGVDIPSAKQAIILASSGNPKEFIQRRGRLMRKFPGKNLAIIYDMVVLPDDTDMPESLRTTELKRVAEFGHLALNKVEIENQIQNRLGGEKWTT